MTKKSSIKEYDPTNYFITLRNNLVHAELSAIQYVRIVEHLDQNKEISEDLKLNLEVQRLALRDNWISCIARLFDKSNGKGDQISIPNLLKNENIKITEEQKVRICSLISCKKVKKIHEIRTNFVAHSLTKETNLEFEGNLQELINECYSLIEDIYNHNNSNSKLSRQSIDKYDLKWQEMISHWK